MPSIKLPPDSNVTLAPPPSSRDYREGLSTHIYFALGAIVIFVAVRLATARSRQPFSQDEQTPNLKDQGREARGKRSWRKGVSTSYYDRCCHPKAEHPAATVSLKSWCLSPQARDQQGASLGSRDISNSSSHPQQAIFAAAGHLPFGCGGGGGGGGVSITPEDRFEPAWQLAAMDGGNGSNQQHTQGHSGSWSAPAASRGVSTNTGRAAAAAETAVREQPNPSFSETGSFGLSAERQGGRRSSSGPRGPTTSSSWQHSRSPDGLDTTSHGAKGEGKGKETGTESMTMDRHVGWVDEYQNSHASPLDGDSEQTSRILSNESSPFRHGANMQGPTSFINVDFASSHFSYPPPPPPLTPPTLSTTIPPFENRRLGSPVSIHHGLETNFIHQPNPDYDVSSSTSTDIPLYSPDYAHSIADTSTTAIPRRRSYTRAVPIGIPASTSSPIAGGNTFSPSSYPPTSPMLPPPPPGYDGGDEGFPPPPSEYQFVGGPGGPGIVLSEEVMDMDMDIRLHGEIVSVMDDAGHGWKRHTRVYGGGVCLACIAAANGGGSREGGFYGDRVPLADRR